MEVQRVNSRLADVTGQQDLKSKADAAALGAGIAFPPLLLFMAVGENKQSELGRLKGEAEALQVVVDRNRCSNAAANAAAKSELQVRTEALDSLRAKGLLSDAEYKQKMLGLLEGNTVPSAVSAVDVKSNEPKVNAPPVSDTIAALIERGAVYNFIKRGERGDVTFKPDGTFSGFGGLYKGTFLAQGDTVCMTSAILGERNSCVEFPAGKRSGETFRVLHPQQGDVEISIK